MRALLSSRRALVLCLGLAALLALPALGSGWFLDDYLYLARLAEAPRSLATAAGLYRLTAAHGGAAQAILHGQLPWWFDIAAKVELCRPLSGVLFAIDRALFGAHAWAAHLHSLLWFLLLALAVGLLLRRLPPLTAGLALLIFVVDDGHWQAMGWLSNRHAVVASAPVMIGLLSHMAWRERGWRPGLPLSLLGQAIGLLGGETALQAMAYLLAYELVGPAMGSGPSPAASLRGTWIRRARALLPSVVLLGAYFAAYRALGFGARGHEQYLDPVAEPARFLAGAATRLPTLLADLLAGLPADLWAALPALHGVYVVLGTLALVAVALLVRIAWRRLDEGDAVELRWLALGAAGALLPGIAGLPGSRLLLVPSIGGAAVVATLLVHLGAAARERALPLRAAVQVARGWLVAVHLVIAPALLLANFANLHTIGAATERMVREAEVEPGTQPAASLDVAVLYAPDLVALLYPPHMLALDPATRYRSWWTLSVAPRDHLLRRTGERTFTLSVTDGAFFDSEWERLFRARRAALRPGDHVRLAGLDAEMIAPDCISFTADRPLDDPSLRLLAWRDGALRRVAVPRVGGVVEIPRSKGLLGL